MPPHGTATVGAVTVTLIARQVNSPIYEFRADIQVDSMAFVALGGNVGAMMLEAFGLAISDYERKLREARERGG